MLLLYNYNQINVNGIVVVCQSFLDHFVTTGPENRSNIKIILKLSRYDILSKVKVIVKCFWKYTFLLSYRELEKKIDKDWKQGITANLAY